MFECIFSLHSVACSVLTVTLACIGLGILCIFHSVACSVLTVTLACIGLGILCIFHSVACSVLTVTLACICELITSPGCQRCHVTSNRQCQQHVICQLTQQNTCSHHLTRPNLHLASVVISRLEFITAWCYTERSIATASRLSVCLSVTLRYRDQRGWKSSTIISPLVSLGCLLSADSNITDLLRETPWNFDWNSLGRGIEKVAFGVQKL